MEILFITHKYPPTIGGMEKQSFELTQRMKQHATVHLLCCTSGESKVRFFWSLKKKIREKLQQHPGISILHFNDGLVAACCSGADDFPDRARVVTLHGLDVVFPSSFFQHKILPRFNNFQSIIAVSQATARACIERGINRKKVIVIPNGVDHDIAYYQPDTATRAEFQARYRQQISAQTTLVMMGRPVRRKGFSWFIKNVFPQLPADYKLLIIGPYRPKRPFSDYLLRLLPPSFRKQLELLFGMPSDEAALRVALKAPALQGRVEHVGKLPFNDILQIMSSANAFIMPNIPVSGDMEGFGLVCLEASLCGLPVFAANLEGITDAIQDQKNGWLLPAGDAAAWVTALTPLHEDPEMMHSFGAYARQHTLENFGWEKMALAYYVHFAYLKICLETARQHTHANLDTK